MLKTHVAAWISAAALLGGAGAAGWTGIQGSAAGQAASQAVKALGGGTVTHVSRDHYHGQAVYDVHVLRHHLWDVKVTPSGQVVLTKLSNEQPSAAGSPPPSAGATVSASAAGKLALGATGGGTVTHISFDHYQGIPIWDVHVTSAGSTWEVKVDTANGHVLAVRPATESSPGRDQEGDRKDTTTAGGIVLHHKLTTIPAGYEGDVQAALQATGGSSVKWIKFDRRDHGGLELKIKIRTGHGTVKVKDLFAPDGHLVSQRIGTDG